MLLGGALGELTGSQRQALLSCRNSLQRVFDLIQEPRGRHIKAKRLAGVESTMRLEAEANGPGNAPR